MSPSLPPVPWNSSPLQIRARMVLPLRGPPLDDGVVAIAAGQIIDIGPWKALRPTMQGLVIDLGEVILFPGLVNTHCHLDYTDMAGSISPPKSFSDWIKALLALKAHWTYSDYALSWIHGAHMLLQHGVTTAIDIEAVPELLPEVRSTSPLRICSLIELTGLRSRRAPAEVVAQAMQKIDSLPAHAAWAGLSPHALYSTRPELLRLSAQAARQRGWLVATHLAESREEFDMFQSGSGPMFEWLQSQRDTSDCGHGSPVQVLHRHGALGRNLLAIHVNYLARGDASLLGLSGASVVHCPRSHAYFGHDPFPRKQLTAAGVNVCVGTDSLASVHTQRGRAHLSLLAELRSMADRQPDLSPAALLKMATLNAARALGLEGKLGELSMGAAADLAVIPFSGPARGSYDAVLQHAQPVQGVMIHGRWVIPPPSVAPSSSYSYSKS